MKKKSLHPEDNSIRDATGRTRLIKGKVLLEKVVKISWVNRLGAPPTTLSHLLNHNHYERRELVYEKRMKLRETEDLFHKKAYFLLNCSLNCWAVIFSLENIINDKWEQAKVYIIISYILCSNHWHRTLQTRLLISLRTPRGCWANACQVTTCFIRSNWENSREKINKVSEISRSPFPGIPKKFRVWL